MITIITLSALLIPLFLSVLYFIKNKEKRALNERSQAGLPGSFIKLSNGTVYYKFKKASTNQLNENKQNNKPTIILVPGFSASSFIWDGNIQPLANAGFNVVSFDFFGRGLSDRPQGDYSIEFLVKQLKDLLDALDINGTVNLVGLAMGAAVVTLFTNTYPKLVNKIILLDPLIKVPPQPILTIFKVPLLGKLLSKVILVPKLQTESLKYLHEPSRHPQWNQKFSMQSLYKGHASAMLKSTCALIGQDFTSDYKKLGQLKKPIQLLWGKYDKTIPIIQSNDIIKLIPIVEFHSIDNAAHLPNYEQAEEVNTKMIDFLDGQ